MDNYKNEVKEKFFYANSFLCTLCKDFDSKLECFNDYHTSQHLFDCWSFIHVIGGIALGLIFNSLIITLILNFLFEFVENTKYGVSFWEIIGISSNIDCLNYDTYINIIGDTICVLFGFYISTLGIKNSIYAIIALIIIFCISSVIYSKNSLLISLHKFLENFNMYN